MIDSPVVQQCKIVLATIVCCHGRSNLVPSRPDVQNTKLYQYIIHVKLEWSKFSYDCDNGERYTSRELWMWTETRNVFDSVIFSRWIHVKLNCKNIYRNIHAIKKINEVSWAYSVKPYLRICTFASRASKRNDQGASPRAFLDACDWMTVHSRWNSAWFVLSG